MTDVSKNSIAVGGFQLNLLTHRLACDDRTVQLSPLASRFLQALAARPGAVVDRAALIDAMWRGDYLTGDPALNRVVSETRRAVGDDPRNPALIQTIHRHGYRLVGVDGGEAVDPAWRVPASIQAPWIKSGLWLTALILIVVGAKVWLDALTGMLWVANNPG